VQPISKHPEAKKLVEMAGKLENTLTDIEENLMQTRSHANEDPLNYPIKLNNKLASLAATIRSSYNRPTQQDYQVFKELSAKVDEQLNRLKPLLHAGLDDFNEAFKNRGVPAVTIAP